MTAVLTAPRRPPQLLAPRGRLSHRDIGAKGFRSQIGSTDDVRDDSWGLQALPRNQGSWSPAGFAWGLLKLIDPRPHLAGEQSLDRPRGVQSGSRRAWPFRRSSRSMRLAGFRPGGVSIQLRQNQRAAWAGVSSRWGRFGIFRPHTRHVRDTQDPTPLHRPVEDFVAALGCLDHAKRHVPGLWG